MLSLDNLVPVILECQFIYSLFCYYYNLLEKDLIIQVNDLIPFIQEGVLDKKTKYLKDMIGELKSS